MGIAGRLGRPFAWISHIRPPPADGDGPPLRTEVPFYDRDHKRAYHVYLYGDGAAKGRVWILRMPEDKELELEEVIAQRLVARMGRLFFWDI